MFYDFPYMLEEEDEYAPPEDAEARESLKLFSALPLVLRG